jgi:Domain of unknown function (DUF1929)
LNNEHGGGPATGRAELVDRAKRGELGAYVAPPGVYMLFIIGADGVPSVARMVHVDPTAPPPPAPPTNQPPAPSPGSTPTSDSGAVPDGTSSTPPTGGTDTVDKKAPVLAARVERRQRMLQIGGVVAPARCDEPCLLSGWGSLRIGGRSYGLVQSQTVRPARRALLKVRLSRGTTRALRRAFEQGRHPTVQIRLRARDVAGNRSSVVRAAVQAVR